MIKNKVPNKCGSGQIEYDLKVGNKIINKDININLSFDVFF